MLKGKLFLVNLLIGIVCLILRGLDVLITSICLSLGASELNPLFEQFIIISFIPITIYIFWNFFSKKDRKDLLYIGIIITLMLLFPVIWNSIGLIISINLSIVKTIHKI